MSTENNDEIHAAMSRLVADFLAWKADAVRRADAAERATRCGPPTTSWGS